MDWKAQLVSSIEAAMQSAIDAALPRSMYASVEESAEETARRRTMWFGEAGRRRIELAEDRARRDPVWAEKMARRHANFRDAPPSTTSPAPANTASTWVASAQLEPELCTLMPGTAMETSSSTAPPSVLTACAVRDGTLAARPPTTCSTNCPGRASASAVSTQVCAATSTTSRVTAERLCFDPEPAAVTSAPEKDLHSVTATTPAVSASRNITKDDLHLQVSTGAIGAPPSIALCESDPVVQEHTTCSKICLGSDTSVVATSMMASMVLGEEPVTTACTARDGCVYPVSQLVAMPTPVLVDVVDCAPTMASPSEGICNPTMSHSITNRRGADDHSITNKHEVPLPLNLLELPPGQTKEQNVPPLLPHVVQDMVSWGTSMNHRKAKISDLCSGFSYPTTNSLSISLFQWDPGEQTRISRKLVTSSVIILSACVKMLTEDSYGNSDHYKQPGNGRNHLDFPWLIQLSCSRKNAIGRCFLKDIYVKLLLYQFNCVGCHTTGTCLRSDHMELSVGKDKNYGVKKLDFIFSVPVHGCELISGFHFEKPWDPGGSYSAAWNCQCQMVLINCKRRLRGVHSMLQWLPLQVNCHLARMHFRFSRRAQMNEEINCETSPDLVVYCGSGLSQKIDGHQPPPAKSTDKSNCILTDSRVKTPWRIRIVNGFCNCSWLEHAPNLSELVVRQVLALHNNESETATIVLGTECYLLHHSPTVQTDHPIRILFNQAPNLQNRQLGAQKGQFSSRIILMSECAIHYGPLTESWFQPISIGNDFLCGHGSEQFQWEIAWLIELDYIAIGNKLRLPVQWDPNLWRLVLLIHKWMVSLSLVEMQPWTAYGILLLVPKVLRIASDNCHGIMMLGKVIREEAFILQEQYKFASRQFRSLSWDTGIWSLLCFFGFFTRDEAEGRRSAAAPAYCHCLGHAYYFAKVCADQDYYLDIFRDQAHIVHDYYIGVFLEQVRAVSYLNLVKVCLDYCIHHDLEEVMKHQVPWDPGGSTRHRLEVKPKIKGEGMLATLLPGIWAASVGPQPARKPHEAGTYIYQRSAYRKTWLGTGWLRPPLLLSPSPSSSRVPFLLHL